MTSVYACLRETVCDVTTVPSHLNRNGDLAKRRRRCHCSVCGGPEPRNCCRKSFVAGSILFTHSLGRVRRPCRGPEKFLSPVIQHWYGCSCDAQEIVHTGHDMLGFFLFFFWRERFHPKVSWKSNPAALPPPPSPRAHYCGRELTLLETVAVKEPWTPNAAITIKGSLRCGSSTQCFSLCVLPKRSRSPLTEKMTVWPLCLSAWRVDRRLQEDKLCSLFGSTLLEGACHGQAYATGSWLISTLTHVREFTVAAHFADVALRAPYAFQYVHGQSRKRNQAFVFQGESLEVFLFASPYHLTFQEQPHSTHCLFAKSQTLTLRHARSRYLPHTLSLFQVRSGRLDNSFSFVCLEKSQGSERLCPMHAKPTALFTQPQAQLVYSWRIDMYVNPQSLRLILGKFSQANRLREN